MKKKLCMRQNNKGFTLIELLVVIAMISLVSSISIYFVGDIVRKSKEKTYEVTIRNIENKASGYLAENGNKLFYISNAEGNEYQCIKVRNLVDYGYLSNDVTKSKVNDNQNVGLDDYIYVERNGKSKALEKSDYIYSGSMASNTLCNNAVNAVGDISFLSNPGIDEWSKFKEITIIYRLKNNNNAVLSAYSYNYQYSAANQLITDNGNSKVVKVTANGNMNADIRHSSDGVIVNKTLQINKIDTTNPTVTLSSENKFKQQAQRVNLKCNDSQSGVEKYYFGEKNITSEDDIRTTKKIKNGSLNITTTIDKPGVYYLACKDKAGNWDVTSIKMVKYTVYNMLDKVTESAGTYTANNYKTISTMGDNLIEEGTIGRPDDFYTSPANIGTQVVYKGYRNNPPGTTHSSIIAGTPNIAVVENGNYSFWFDRKTYSITLDSGDGISSVSGAGTYKWGAIATIDAVVKPGYEWDKWTDKNLSLSSSKNYTVAIGTSNVTYKANAKDITKPTVELIGTSKLKSTSQTMTLKCSDKQSGLSAYYFGTTEPTSATDATIVRSDDLTALASASGLSKNITSAGKYWLICKDKTGNYEKKSVTMIGYTVYNMLDKITGTIGVYNTTNYDTSSSTNYITIPGVSGKTSELYTNPGNSVYKGYKNASPGATAITSLSEGDPSIDIATNGKYSFWFDRKTYTITYNVNGGSGTPENQTKKHGGTATISSTIPTRTGYNFLGWGTSSGATTVSYSAGASYTTNANLSLYAIWGIKTYTITYDANDGNGAPSSQTKTHDIALTLSSTKPTRTGYTFLGWNTSKTSTTANSSYAPGKTYGTNANLTLYAVWSANTYTISYNENGGSGAPSSQTKRHGETATLSSTKPTRTGYTFLGWNTSKTSATANSSYAPGKTYGTNADLTLYAVWSINKYTVKFDSDGGSAVSNQTVNYNGKATKPNNPTKTGYTFKEWRLSGSTSAYDFNTSVTKDITLKAVWESACSASNPTACPKLYVCDITSTYFRLNPGYDYVYQGVASVCTSNIYECSDYSNTDIDHDQPFYKLGESGDFYIIYSPFDIYVEGGYGAGLYYRTWYVNKKCMSSSPASIDFNCSSACPK